MNKGTRASDQKLPRRCVTGSGLRARGGLFLPAAKPSGHRTVRVVVVVVGGTTLRS